MDSQSYIAEKNNEIIRNIVFNHFGLDEESKQRFANALVNPDIDPIYGNLLGPDYRARFPVNKLRLEAIDESWILFKTLFPTYYKQYNISYRDYVAGKIKIGKNIFRIFKHLPIYYFEDEKGVAALKLDMGLYQEAKVNTVKENFNYNLNLIIEKRLPAKEEFEIVISRNFADWFLCSTGENWTTCLNLDSTWDGAYWLGLPGFIVDKNKAMIYITTGEKKEKFGIITDKMITRSFLTITKKNEIRALRWYPNENFYDNGAFLELSFDLKMFNEDYDDVKYKVKPLFFKSGWSCFAYQDKTHFKYDINENLNNEATLISVHKGGQTFIFKDDPNQFNEGPIFNWDGGLRGLIDQNVDINNYQNTDRCFECHERISLDESYDYNGEIYCENCYNDLFRYCEGCDNSFPREETINVGRYGIYCEDCYDELLTTCEHCNKIIPKDEIETHICRNN